jgi:hypothetical protein
MQGTVPPIGAAQMEMSRTMESEGHANFSGLFSWQLLKHFPSQRIPFREAVGFTG